MDIARPDRARKKRRQRIVLNTSGVFLLLAMVLWLLNFDPGPFRIDRELVWTGEVERGVLIRQIRGVGSLVPAEIRWVAARSAGRVERILILPGTRVESDSVIMELSNPELLQETQALELQLKSEEARFLSFKARLQSELLKIKSNVAQLKADFKQAELVAKMDAELFEQGLESELAMRRSRLKAEQFESRLSLEQQRLSFQEQAIKSQVSAERSNIEQTRAHYELLKGQLDGLTLRAAYSGVLQRQMVTEGEQVKPGQNLAQVANPDSLIAKIRISEHQAKDIAISLPAEIDTRDGIISGKVSRIDPNVQEGTVTVDVQLTSAITDNARPDLTIEGTIEVESIADTLFVGRPAYARQDSSVNVYRFVGDSDIAERITVSFGKASVDTIEVLSGLSVGERIILSDTSDWGEHDVIKLN